MKNSKLLEELVKKTESGEITLIVPAETYPNDKEGFQIEVRIAEKNSLVSYELGTIILRPKKTTKEKLQDVYNMRHLTTKSYKVRLITLLEILVGIYTYNLLLYSPLSKLFTIVNCFIIILRRFKYYFGNYIPISKNFISSGKRFPTDHFYTNS
jgi:hypothetical protein